MIYLDNNATTALDPSVEEACLKELRQGPSNPSSVHAYGRKARARLLEARESIASYFGAKPEQLVFTSSATEALNMLLRGIDGPILSSDLEHASVYHTLATLSQAIFLKGPVSAAAVEAALTDKTRYLVFMACNNETGVKNDLAALSALALQRGLHLIVDATAWIGREPFMMHEGISALVFSAHKFHGPKGIAAALIRRSLKCRPLLTGGHQEFKKRAGTENLMGILGLQAALLLPDRSAEIRRLRDLLEAGVEAIFPGVVVNGKGYERICNTSNLSFPSLEGETLLMKLDLANVFVSHGSACSSGALEPSRVLAAMGLSKELTSSSLRFSLSRMTSEEEIKETLEILKTLLNHL